MQDRSCVKIAYDWFPSEACGLEYQSFGCSHLFEKFRSYFKAKEGLRKRRDLFCLKQLPVSNKRRILSQGNLGGREEEQALPKKNSVKKSQV